MAIILDGTNGAFLPTWTTATRPASPANGEIGYNSTTGQLDQYVGSAWSSIPTGSAAAATPTVLGTVYGSTNATNLTFIGYGAGTSNTGTYNTFIGGKDDYYGISAGGSNTSGANNTAVGSGAIPKNVTGSNITSVGMDSGQNCTAGPNTFVGLGAGSGNTSGTNNIAMGYRTLGYTGAGGAMSYNIAIGDQALTYNTSGINCTAIGYQAGFSNTTDNGITAVGHQALYSNTTGSGDSHNVAIGRQAMYTNSIGYYSVGVGYRALYAFNNNGGYNVAVGYQAMAQATTAGACNAFGYRAGYGLTGGSGGNTFIGTNAGSNITTGSYNTMVGNDSTGAGATDGSEIVLGNNSVGKGSNTAFVNPNGGGLYAGNNSSSLSTTSDRRLKKNIVDNTEGLDKVVQIRVRNFEYRLPEEVTELETHCAIPKTGVQLGVIAQELREVLPDCTKEESTGVIAVDSDNIFWHMVNAIKDLKAIVDAQAVEIADLKAKVA